MSTTYDPRSPRLLRHLLLVVAAVGMPTAVHGGATPEQQCQKARYDAAAKYEQCVQKTVGKYLGVGTDAQFVKFREGIAKCRIRYTDTWGKLQAKASGTGSTCDAARLVVVGEIVTDALTGLQWERKGDARGIHDKDGTATWSAAGTAADGTAYISFLETLNNGLTATCFAGHCDWRLPTLAELETIRSGPFPCTGTCIDETIFGPVAVAPYWSSTSIATAATEAWVVFFTSAGAGILNLPKTSSFAVRAVRGGL